MRTTVMNALIHPIHVLTLIIAAIAGLVAAWWLFPIGGLVWLGMVLRYINDPTEKLRQKIEERQPVATRFDTPFRALQKVQVQMYNAISNFPSTSRKELQPVLDRMTTLVDEVYRVCLQLTPVENYQKVSDSVANLELQLNQTNTQVKDTTDPVTRNAYEETSKALTQRIDQQKQASAQLERVDAFLASLINDLNAVLGKVISLQAKQGDQLHAEASAIVLKIEQEISEVKTLSNM